MKDVAWCFYKYIYNLCAYMNLTAKVIYNLFLTHKNASFFYGQVILQIRNRNATLLTFFFLYFSEIQLFERNTNPDANLWKTMYCLCWEDNSGDHFLNTSF